MTRTTWLALALATIASAQEPKNDHSLANRLAAWQLEATVGAPSGEAIAALKALVTEAETVAALQTHSLAKMKAQRTVATAKTTLARYQAEPSKQTGRTISSLEDELLQREVAAALERGDRKFLEKLGDHATAPLTGLALRSSGIPAKDGGFGALSWLRNRSPAAALDVIVQLLKSPSKLVREEAFRQAQFALNSGNQSVWQPNGALSWTLADPSWASIPDQAVDEDGLNPNIRGGILETFAGRGLLPRTLTTTAIQLANEGHLSPISLVPDEETLWFYRNLFENGSLQVRYDVIRYLWSTPNLDVTYAGAMDDREDTQRALARHLLARETGAYTDPARTDRVYLPYFPEPSETLTSTFKALVTSKFPKAAQAAVANAYQRVEDFGSLPFGSDTILELLASVDSPDLLWSLATLTGGLPEEERVRTLAAAIQRAAPLTEESARSNTVAQVLQTLEAYGIATSDSFWPIADVSAPFLRLKSKTTRSQFTDLVDQGVRHKGLDPSGMLPWLEQHGQGHEWPLIQNFGNNGSYCQWIRSLTEADRFQLLVELSTTVFDENRSGVSKLLRGGYLKDAALLERAIRDPRSSDAVKVEAAEYLLKQTKAPLAEGLLPEIAAAYGRYRNSPGTFFLPYMEESQRAQVFALWLADPSVADRFILQSRFSFQDEGTMEAVMGRFPRSGWAKIDLRGPELLKDAVNFAVQHSSETLHPLLMGDLTEASRMYEWIAFTIKGNRSEVLQPVAMAILAEGPSGRAWIEAVQAVAGYFNSEGAAALLEAAKSTSSAADRKIAMDALREITKWREASRAWSRAADAEVKRADAIAELAMLVKDSAKSVDVRAASLRGLGLLAAAEELPLIIESMTSDEPRIQAAARAALARLEQEADR